LQTGDSSKLIAAIETGRKSLTVYYDAGKDDYDKAITKALACHGLKEGQVSVFAHPLSISPSHTP